MHLKKIPFIISAGVVIACSMLSWHSKKATANEAPKVVIKKPSGKERFKWDALLSYEIFVSDKEDGSSEYNEIDEKEVFLKIRYLADTAGVRAYVANEAKEIREPLE